jgi:hypothetical protein
MSSSSFTPLTSLLFAQLSYTLLRNLDQSLKGAALLSLAALSTAPTPTSLGSKHLSRREALKV